MTDHFHDDKLATLPLPPPYGPGDVFYRHRYAHLRDHYLQTDPRLWEKIEAQAAQFAIVARTYIEPAMQDVAAEVSRQGWYPSIIYDDPHNVTKHTTPGISLVLARTRFFTLGFSEESFGAVIRWYGDIEEEHIQARANPDFTNPVVRPIELGFPLEYADVSNGRFKAATLQMIGLWNESLDYKQKLQNDFDRNYILPEQYARIFLFDQLDGEGDSAKSSIVRNHHANEGQV